MNKLPAKEDKELSIVFISIMIIVLPFIAGFRPLEHFRDTSEYLNIIHTYNNIWDAEPTVWIINQFNLLFLGGNDQIFFFIYAMLGVTIKITAIRRLSLLPILSIYIYICLYFILHEMTQIRAGVAAGIFLLALPDILNRDFKNYLFKILLAMAFHYSAIILFLLYFLDPKEINKKVFLSLPIIGLVLAFNPGLMVSFFELLALLLPGDIGGKVNMYIQLIDDDAFNKINIFNFFTLSLIIIFYFSIINLDKFKSKFDVLLMKIFSLQLFVYYAFSSIPVFAMRLSELLGVALIITLAHVIILFEEKLIVYSLLCVWLSLYLWYIGISRLIIT
ncbi:MAG: EpsG family protein [Ghiorsea sp.]